MSIAVLPARLANQIAAGEVVERPASVVKELVENSLDAQATQITIDIEQGGAKRIRITDNGKGIVKDELVLALSRHATSKIKDLDDLEGIASLGFRGEALASISSVSRLTLTSKPAEQSAAWQAEAQGRDMQVVVQPAAHPDGTTIDVKDLFFNTPARRKFLRTDKTEFAHIDEVIRRIALARFDVSFILNHNGKQVRYYRKSADGSKNARRVAQVCGQKFIDNAIEINCEHDGLTLWGWVAKPSFFRPQNDLCYSYVNGRMMRDKLINHAIRQAYDELLPSDAYPAFVLYLDLDVREVDVNVHPAKHEVRFHQGRYVHDFIYSVCHKALVAQVTTSEFSETVDPQTGEVFSAPQTTGYPSAVMQTQQQVNDVVQPLRSNYQAPASSSSAGNALFNWQKQGNMSQKAAAIYQQLLQPSQQEQAEVHQPEPELEHSELLVVEQQKYAVIKTQDQLRLLNIGAVDTVVQLHNFERKWQQGLVSQPLLLPVAVKLNKQQIQFIEQHLATFEQAGIAIHLGANKIEVRQFPAPLRNKDVAQICTQLIDNLSKKQSVSELNHQDWQRELSQHLISNVYTIEDARQLLLQGQMILKQDWNKQLDLNSVSLDLTSSITKLEKAVATKN